MWHSGARAKLTGALCSYHVITFFVLELEAYTFRILLAVENFVEWREVESESHVFCHQNASATWHLVVYEMMDSAIGCVCEYFRSDGSVQRSLGVKDVSISKDDGEKLFDEPDLWLDESWPSIFGTGRAKVRWVFEDHKWPLLQVVPQL